MSISSNYLPMSANFIDMTGVCTYERLTKPVLTVPYFICIYAGILNGAKLSGVGQMYFEVFFFASKLEPKLLKINQ